MKLYETIYVTHQEYKTVNKFNLSTLKPIWIYAVLNIGKAQILYTTKQFSQK